MGLFDGITGSRAAVAGIEPISSADLRQALLALNREDQAWVVRESDRSNVDLAATWKFDDPKWAKQLQEADMTGVSILMHFHEDVHTVRSVDEMYSLTWDAGIGHAGLAFSYFRGQEVQKEATWTFGRRADGKFGVDYKAGFSSEDIKDALRKVVTEHGWSWRGMMIGRL